MKVFIGSLVIFFGTLLAAGLVALGQPGLPSDASHPTSAAGSSEPVWERLFAIRGLR